VRVPFAIPAGTSNVDFEEMEKLITIRTKMICLCNPLNPTEKYFLKMNLQLGKIACKHNLIILSDEIWSDIVFLPAVFTSIASIT
jgi:aspartate/methionine/tyrosine aminotransferase